MNFPKKKNISKITLGDLLHLSIRNFKAKSGRTFLTVLGIGVSFATIFFLVSLGYGLQNILLSQISSEESLLTADVISPRQDVLPITKKTLEKISEIEGVKKVSPIISIGGHIDAPDNSFEVVYNAVSQDFFHTIGRNLKGGRVPKENENGILVSSDLGRMISGDKEFSGAKFKLNFFVPVSMNGQDTIKVVEKDYTFEIVGILDDSNSNFVYLPFSHLSDADLPYSSVKIVASNKNVLEDIKLKISEMGFSVSSVADTVEQANKIFTIFKIILAFFGAAALVVAVVGMINTMTIALLERTNEIGVMKIFGITETDVQKLFMIEATFIGFLGGLSGILMGYMSSQIFNFGIGILAKSLGGKSVSLFSYPLWFVTAIIFFASLVGLITGYFPSRRAARLDPLNALRYK